MAQEFTVRDIRVEGVQRTEAGTVFSYLPVRVGDRFDPERGSQAIRALYASGLFKDVRLEVDGDVLVVLVEERPAVAAVELSGVKEFDKDQVVKSLREVGLAEGRIFDRSLLERSEQELRRQYLSRGLYGVEVKTTVTPIERNRVNVSMVVNEGDIARIRSITFTGNSVFSDSTLRDAMELSTPNWLSWYTKRDQYSRQKLGADLESIRSFYLNRGFLDFRIESTQVSISPDKNDIFINVNLFEGERYTVSGVKLSGELLGLEEELVALIDVKPGETFNAERLNAVAKRITDRMATLGYAFATANPMPEPDKENRTVAFTIVVDPGRRVYVRRVNIGGNSRTKDEVDPPRDPAVRVGVVRLREGPPVARPHRPARLLRVGEHRDARRAERARPGRRQRHGQGARDREHPDRRRLLEHGRGGAHGRPVAAEPVRQRQRPVARDQHEQGEPHHLRSPTPTRTSPPKASAARSSCSTASRTSPNSACRAWATPRGARVWCTAFRSPSTTASSSACAGRTRRST